MCITRVGVHAIAIYLIVVIYLNRLLCSGSTVLLEFGLVRCAVFFRLVFSGIAVHFGTSMRSHFPKNGLGQKQRLTLLRNRNKPLPRKIYNKICSDFLSKIQKFGRAKERRTSRNASKPKDIDQLSGKKPRATDIKARKSIRPIMEPLVIKLPNVTLNIL